MASTSINLRIIKAKLALFKLDQLKEVLQQLSMTRSGRKDDLNKRLLDYFTDVANLNASGHRVAGQEVAEGAARTVDAVYSRLRQVDEQYNRSMLQHRHIDAIEAQERAAAGGSDAAAGGPTKRPRTDAPAAAKPPPQQQQFDGGELPVEEVIGRFLDGSEGLGPLNTQVRCLCAQATRREPLLQCCGACCGVWQHADCAKQQLQPSGPGAQPLLDPATFKPLVQRQAFFCERCRVSRADPFWELFDPTVMQPVRGSLTNMTAALGALGEVRMSSTGMLDLVLSKQQVTLLQAKEQEYKLQALCLQLDDPVPFRFHWPVNSSVTIHAPHLAQKVNATRRGQMSKLGPNQRDEPFDLTAAVQPAVGVSTQCPWQLSVELTYNEPEPHYLFMVAIMRQRTREQVKALMRQPETLEAAVQRVRRHMRGASSSTSSDAAAAAGSSSNGAAAGNGCAVSNGDSDRDDDDDVIMGNTVVSLKDPFSNTRMATAARFVDTAGAAPSAFDLELFLDMAQSTRKWMDPHSNKPSCVQSLQVDGYLTHVLRVLAGLPDVTEVEITPEALWRPAGSRAAFMSVLEQAQDMRAAVAAAAAAAASVVAADGGAGGDSEEEDEDEQFRREVAQMQDRKPQLQQAGGVVEVIEILDSDDEEEQSAQQQQQLLQPQPAEAAAGPGVLTAGVGSQQQLQQQRAQAGLVIRLPARTQLQQAATAAGRVVSPRQQQQQGVTLGSAARAAAATAAAAVGPPVRVASGGQQQQLTQGLAGSRTHIIQTGVAGGIAQQQQQQLPQQQMPQLPALQEQVPGAALLQQQLSGGLMQQPQQLQLLSRRYSGGVGVQQGSAPMLLVQGSSMAMQGSLPVMSLAMGSLAMTGLQQLGQTSMPLQHYTSVPLQQVQYLQQQQQHSSSSSSSSSSRTHVKGMQHSICPCISSSMKCMYIIIVIISSSSSM
ncbi:hypothetical protein COO60DRAFT_110528 [Scenedesmus sp. NREL 46B-D3]|nr:hypothetical protein COO60DRAFT_110528 [Scenedesmus sp. NREL 46B-D3]